MELIHNLRGTTLASLAKVLIIALLAVTAYNLVSFSQSTRAAVNKSFAESAELDFYGLSDQLTDPDAFERFRSSPQNIREVARFRDELEADDRLKLLSVFDQNIPVLNFKGDSKFEYGYGTEIGLQGPHPEESLGGSAVNIKSVQMNKTAFDFYNLGDHAAAPIDWATVSYSTAPLPVLLGADYVGVYDIGDTFKGNYYSHITDFKVVGFLAASSSIFYQNDINFYLDDYVVVPYPPSIADFAESDAYFYGILAFAMINANVAAPTTMSTEAVLAALQVAGNRSGFTDYALINVPSYITQFGLVRDLITGNLALLIAIEVGLAIGSLVVAGALTRYMLRRRNKRVQALWILGRSMASINRTTFGSAVVEYVAVGIVLFVILQRLPNQDTTGNHLMIAGVIALFLADAIWQQRLVRGSFSDPARNTA